MQDILRLEVVAATADSGFSLDELIVNLNQLMHERGMPGIVGLLIDQRLCLAICRGDGWIFFSR